MDVRGALPIGDDRRRRNLQRWEVALGCWGIALIGKTQELSGETSAAVGRRKTRRSPPGNMNRFGGGTRGLQTAAGDVYLLEGSVGSLCIERSSLLCLVGLGS